MPKLYLNCVKDKIAEGKSKKDAQRICAIWYYKVFGKTPQQDESSAAELVLFDVINAVGSILTLKND